MNLSLQQYSMISITLAASIFLYGCDDENQGPIDQTAPTIDVLNPTTADYFDADGAIPFNAVFTDELELGSYSIDVHHNLEGHTHGRIAVRNEDPSLLKWTYRKNFIMPEDQKIYNADLVDEIAIPANTVAGPYHFIVQAVDKAANATSFQDGSNVELEVYIHNNSMPIVNITNLVDGELEIEVGQVFITEGDVTDPTTNQYAGMHLLEVVLGEATEDGSDHNHGGRLGEDGHGNLIETAYDENELESFMMDGKIILDDIFDDINFTLSPDQQAELIEEEVDHLLLNIRVHDEQGNIAVSNTEVHLIE